MNFLKIITRFSAVMITWLCGEEIYILLSKVGFDVLFLLTNIYGLGALILILLAYGIPAVTLWVLSFKSCL